MDTSEDLHAFLPEFGDNSVKIYRREKYIKQKLHIIVCNTLCAILPVQTKMS
jgi:hypothetical protein